MKRRKIRILKASDEPAPSEAVYYMKLRELKKGGGKIRYSVVGQLKLAKILQHKSVIGKQAGT